MIATVDCIMCTACYEVCKEDALNVKPGGQVKIDEVLCNNCGECVKVCPVDAIIEVE